MSQRIKVVVQVPVEFAAVIEQVAQAVERTEALESLELLEALTDAENKKISQAMMQAAFLLKARLIREKNA